MKTDKTNFIHKSTPRFLRAGPLSLLSERENQIFGLISAGYSDKKILSLTEIRKTDTLGSYISAINQKLEIKSRNRPLTVLQGAAQLKTDLPEIGKKLFSELMISSAMLTDLAQEFSDNEWNYMDKLTSGINSLRNVSKIHFSETISAILIKFIAKSRLDSAPKTADYDGQIVALHLSLFYRNQNIPFQRNDRINITQIIILPDGESSALEFLCMGCSTAKMAETLRMSENLAEGIRNRAMARLDCRDPIQMVLKAFEQGYVDISQIVETTLKDLNISRDAVFDAFRNFNPRLNDIMERLSRGCSLLRIPSELDIDPKMFANYLSDIYDALFYKTKALTAQNENQYNKQILTLALFRYFRHSNPESNSEQPGAPDIKNLLPPETLKDIIIGFVMKKEDKEISMDLGLDETVVRQVRTLYLEKGTELLN